MIKKTLNSIINAIPFHFYNFISQPSPFPESSCNDFFYKVKPKIGHVLPKGLIDFHFQQEEKNECSSIKFYFDLGYGYTVALSVKKHISIGRNTTSVYIPHTCIGLLVSYDEPTIKILGITRSKGAITNKLEESFLIIQNNLSSGFRIGGNIQPDHITPNFLNAKNNDPFVYLKKKKLRSGWYMLETKVTTDYQIGNAKFYFDYGSGFSEENTTALPFRGKNIVKRLVYIPKTTRNIRFDPIEATGRFSIDHLQIKRVSSFFAKSRMLLKIQNKHRQLKNKKTSEIARIIKNKDISATYLNKIYAEYNTCFNANIQSLNYPDWIAEYEPDAFPDLAKIQHDISHFEISPLISIVTPVYNPDHRYLHECLESVLSQSYSNWQLCLIDDCSTDTVIREILHQYQARDSRVQVHYRSQNGHISLASNDGLAMAKGEFVALLDHDDKLHEHALYAVVKQLQLTPDAQIIYSDEDKIDEDNVRQEPHFKSDWNPDLLFSQNYISHLGVYRTKLLNKIGGFRTGVEGSQDYDLVLRATAFVQAEQIVHIPWVLYHWRAVSGSTALDAESKSYTTQAGIKALQNHFAAMHIDATVTAGLVENTYRVHWPLPAKQPLVSLIIPTRDGYSILKQCIDSILSKTTYQNYEIIIVDNQSSDPKTLGYFESLMRSNNIRVISYNDEFNYSAINNFAVQHAQGELIGLINNDIEVISPDWLTEMVSHAIRPDVGCVGAKLYYPDNTIQHAGVICGLGGVAGHSHKYFPAAASGYFHRLKVIQNLSAVTAAVLLVKKSVFVEVGGLNEQNLKIAFNDVDFCLKVKTAGYRNLWTPYAELYHHESISRGAEDSPEKIERFRTEIEYMKMCWKNELLHDPYYSPNLTLVREDFSIK